MKEVKVVPVAEDFLVDFGEVERLALCKFLAHDERCVVSLVRWRLYVCV